MLPVDREGPPGAAGATAAAPAAAESALPPAPSKEELYLDHLKRLQAEFDNYRKRIAKEKGEWLTRAKGDVLIRFLGVLDNFERALAVPTLPPEVALGLEMIRKEFLAILAEEGVRAIEPVGKPFDHSTSEAISTRESPEPAGTVLEELRRGYRHGERLLRAAQVVVARAPEKKE